MLTKEEIIALGGRVFIHNPNNNYGVSGWLESMRIIDNSWVDVNLNGSFREHYCELTHEYGGYAVDYKWLYSYDPNKMEPVDTVVSCKPTKDWSDSHYDFKYQLTEDDIKKGFIKLDPYFVAKEWKIGSKDDSGALFHSFKLFARWADKNNVAREIEALYRQTKRMAELYGVNLED